MRADVLPCLLCRLPCIEPRCQRGALVGRHFGDVAGRHHVGPGGKRDRRRHRRRRGGHEERGEGEQHKPQEHRERDTEAREFVEEEGKGSTLFSSLIPPPPTLISETLSRYREKEVPEHKEHEHKEHGHKGHEHKEHGHEHKEPTSEAPPEPRDRNEEEPGADSTPLHRVSTKEDAVQEVTSFNATYFTTFTGGSDSFF